MTDTNKDTPEVVDTEIDKDAILGTDEEGGEKKETKEQPADDFDPEEDIARQSGWVPKDEWKGKPGDWRPAKEFNERGEFFTRIKSQSKEMADLRNAVNMLVTQQSKQYMKGFEDAVSRLKADRARAIEAGDLTQVVEITDAIDNVKEKQQEAARSARPNAPTQPTETFKSWHSSNQWYMVDKSLSTRAEEIADVFRGKNPDSTEIDMLEHVARAVRKEFPTKFKSNKGPPSPDGDGRQGGGGKRPSGGDNKFADMESEMTEDQRSIMKTILRQTKMTKEEYFKQYAEAR